MIGFAWGFLFTKQWVFEEGCANADFANCPLMQRKRWSTESLAVRESQYPDYASGR
jgi:hypothetical protein